MAARRFLFGLFLILNLPAGAAEDSFFHLAGSAQYRVPPERVETLPDIPVGRGGEQPLHATVFRPRTPAPGSSPAIIFIHGGGWRSRSPKNTYGAWLAEHGYLVANIQYRLSGEAKWPAQIEDCKLGVRWLRANSGKFQIDPNRIGVFGTSAGGHLAACVGLIRDPKLEGNGGHPGVSSAVAAVGVFCPPTDFTVDWLTGGKPHPPWVVALMGMPREENPAVWKQASPAQHVRANAPPFYIAHGETDTHAPFAQGKILSDALQRAGASVEWVPIRNGTHDFFVNPTSANSKLEPTREAIMAGLLNFFDRHLNTVRKSGGR